MLRVLRKKKKFKRQKAPLLWIVPCVCLFVWASWSKAQTSVFLTHYHGHLRHKDAGKQMLARPAANGCLWGVCVNQTVPSGIRSVHEYYTIEDLLIKSPKPKTVTVIPDSNWIPVSRQIIREHWAHLSLGRKPHRRAVGFACPPSLSPCIHHCAEQTAHQDAMKSCCGVDFLLLHNWV